MSREGGPGGGRRPVGAGPPVSRSSPRQQRRARQAERLGAPWARAAPRRRIRPLAGVAAVAGSQLARTSGLIIATTVLTSILGFVYWILAARTYPSAAVGTAAVSVSVMTLAALLSMVGSNSAVVQRIPARAMGREWNLTVSLGLGVAGGLGLVTGAVGWLAMLLVVRAPGLISLPYAAVLIGGVALTNCSLVLDSVWVVERSASVRLMASVLMSLSKLPLLFVPFLHGLGFVGIQAGWTLAVLVGLCLSVTLLVRRRGFRFSLHGARDESRAMRRSMAGNYLVNLGAMTPSYAIPVLVGAAVSASRTAYFYSAWRVGGFFFVAASSLSSALFAEGSRSPQDAVRNAQRALLLIVPGLGLAMIAFTAIGPGLLQAFGTQYRKQALLLLLLLIAAAIPDALTSIYRTMLRLRSRYAEAARFIWGVALLQIILTWFLLPRWGITGAGAAWLFAELAGVLYAGTDLLRQRFRVGPPPIRPRPQAVSPWVDAANTEEVLR